MFTIRALCVLAVSVPFVAAAQTTYTWNGGGSDNNWNTAGNWSNGVPANSGNSVLVFSGSTRTNTNNNLGDWNLSIGRLEFASGASSFTLSGNNFGFDPYLGSQTQQILQTSANTQTIGVGAFSFRNGSDSQINLNAGDLVASSANVYIDASSSATRHLYVTGTDSSRRTLTFAGSVNKGGSGNDPRIVIQANKRVLVSGSLNYGSGNNDALFIDDGVLQFSGAGTMTGGRPVLGATSGTGSAAVWLDTAGATLNRQFLLRDGSSGRRTIGGLNTSGTTTFSGDVTGGTSDYDLAAASGGTAVFSGGRNISGSLYVNRPDEATAYGGTVILSGTTNSSSATSLAAGTLQISNLNQIGSGPFYFDADSGDSGTFRYTGLQATTTRSLVINKPGITRAAIDVSVAGQLTWNPVGGARYQNLTKVGAGALVFNGTIEGGNVVVEDGALLLSASNSYSGGTVVSSGALIISSTSSSGPSPSALGTGTVSIASAGMVDYRLNSSGTYTVTNPFVIAGGTLRTYIGTPIYSGPVTLASGESTIGSYTGGYTATFSGGLSGTGNVLFSQQGTSNQPATFVLSGTGANTGTVRVAGSGYGVPTLQLASVNALRDATLDLQAPDVANIQFSVAGVNTYNLGGLQGSRNLNFGVNSLSIGGNGGSTTYSGALSGAGVLTKVGGGTLTLAGDNSYSGGTLVSAGSLVGSTLSLKGAITNNATVMFSQATSGTYHGEMSGSGSLIKTGGGTLTLSGSNTYSGGTTLSGGGLYGASWSLQGNIATSAGTVVTFAQAIAGFYAGNLSGAGSLTKSGVGALVLSGTNTYSGGTVVSAGTLVGTASSLQGAITNNATVRFNQATSGTYSGGMTGTGSLEKSGDGDLTLSGSNSYTGGTNVQNLGTLTIANADALSNSTLTGAAHVVFAQNSNVGGLSGGLTIDNGGYTLTIGGNNASTTSLGIISGSGGLIKNGTGSLTLSYPNYYSGDTRIAAGVLRVGDPQSLVNSTLDMNESDSGRIVFAVSGAIGGLKGSRDLQSNVNINIGGNNADTTYSGHLSGSGNFVKKGTGTLTLTGSSYYTGFLGVDAGGVVGSTASLRGSIVNNASVTFDQSTDGVYSGQMMGGGSLTKVGVGTLTLAGTNSYGGGTIVSAGSLVGSTWSLKGAITNNATVMFSQATSGTYSGVMSGSGSLIKTGRGNLILTGSNSYTGGTVLDAGSLWGSTTGLQGSITNNGDVSFFQSTSGTYSGAMSGTGSLGKGFAGSLTLTGSNSFTGPTRISNGSVSIGNGGTTGSLISSVSLSPSSGNTASLVFNRSDASTYAGNISGKGSLTKLGGGTLTLTGSNTFKGDTTVSAGTLVLGSGNALSTTAAVTVASGATLQATTPIRIGYLDSSGTVVGNENLTSTLTVTRSGNIGGLADGTDSQGTFAAGIVKLGSGTSTVNASNSYTGLTWVREGTLAVGTANAFAAASDLTVDSGATLSNTGSSQPITVNDVSVYGTIVSVGGRLTSTGVLNGSGSITGDVLTTGTFHGTQSITGDVEVQGVHAPGNSAGIQTVTGNLAYTAGGTGPSMEWELFANGNSNSGTTVFDQVLVSGNLTFSTSTAFSMAFDGAGSTVDWADGFWTTNEQWTVWQVGGTTTGIGSLSLTSSDWLDANGQSFSTSLSGATFSLGLGANGKDVVLLYVAPVPEPSTWAMLGAGAVVAGWRSRRRLLARTSGV